MSHGIQMKNKLTLSLDFDDTFTAHPEFWARFINLAHTFGHKVICVTARDNTESDLREIKQALPGGMQIIFTEMAPKKQFCEDQGIEIDIWIDDRPDMVVNLNQLIHEVDVLHRQVQHLTNENKKLRQTMDRSSSG